MLILDFQMQGQANTDNTDQQGPSHQPSVPAAVHYRNAGMQDFRCTPRLADLNCS